jgi:uracil-DNA glycosylase
MSPRPQFGHGEVVRFGEGLPALVGCYHPSRQNTNTGKLTAPMMESVFRRAKRLLEK